MNDEIKLAAAGKGIKLWEIAEKLGITDGNLSRKLRHELSEDMKLKIYKIIDELADRRK